MRNSLRRIVAVVALIAMMVMGVFGSVTTTHAQTSGGRLRIVHAVPGAPAVDVSIDGALAAHNLDYAKATRYLAVAAGDHTVSVKAGGKEIFSGKVTLAAGQAFTAVLEGTAAAVELGLNEDDLGPVAPGNIRFTAIHAIKDAGAVDVVRGDGSPLIQALQYNTPYGGFDIPASATTLLLLPTGTTDVSGAIVKAEDLSLVAGTHNTLIALGTAKGSVKPSYVLLSEATDAEQPANSAFVRFVHAVSGGPAVDIYLGDKLIAPNLVYGAATPHVALDPKGGALAIREAGATDKTNLLEVADLGVSGGTAVTVVIGIDDNGKPKANIVADNISSIDPKTARVNVINATGSGAATLTLGGKSIVTDSVKGSAFGDVPAGVYSAAVAVDKPVVSTTSDLALNGGVLYDVVVTGDSASGNLIVAGTSLNEQPGSAATDAAAVADASTPDAAGAATEAAVEATAEAPAETPTVVAEQPTTEPPTEAPAADVPTATPENPDLVPAVPTATEGALVVETQPPAQPVFEGVLGTVYNLNEGVNLKLREYPRADSRALGLLPKDTQLIINGIKGTAVPVGSTPTPKPTEGPTPTVNTDGVDPNTIWLNATWQTPDGGSVTGWVSSQYVRLTRKNRELKELTDILTLPKVPEDRAGEINSSSVTPIAESNDIIGTIQVDEGTNLQMRRTPSIDGESLALLPAAAQIVVLKQTEGASKGGLVGEPKSTVWLWARYVTDTGSVTGWVNSQYIVLTRNGKKFELKDIPVAKEIETGFADQSSGGGAPVAVVPPAAGLIATVDKLNPGANLQMRRDPNAAAESLSLVPAGSQLVIVGRNQDGNWLRVQYEGSEGWINSQYVSVTRNGKKYDIALLSNVSGAPDIIGTVTPGPSPTATGTPAS